jgi:hypothetical protein
MISKKSDKTPKSHPNNRALLKVIRFSKKVVIFSIFSVVVFTIVMTIVIITGNRDPDTLITEFFSYFKIEGGILGTLKAVETVIGTFGSRSGSVAETAVLDTVKNEIDVLGNLENN